MPTVALTPRGAAQCWEPLGNMLMKERMSLLEGLWGLDPLRPVLQLSYTLGLTEDKHVWGHRLCRAGRTPAVGPWGVGSSLEGRKEETSGLLADGTSESG